MDNLATLKINGLCDNVMKEVIANLGLKIPEFILTRRLTIRKNKKNEVTVKGVDADGLPY